MVTFTDKKSKVMTFSEKKDQLQTAKEPANKAAENFNAPYDKVLGQVPSVGATPKERQMENAEDVEMANEERKSPKCSQKEYPKQSAPVKTAEANNE